jgi:hypothetical protein
MDTDSEMRRRDEQGVRKLLGLHLEHLNTYSTKTTYLMRRF